MLLAQILLGPTLQLRLGLATDDALASLDTFLCLFDHVLNDRLSGFDVLLVNW